MMTIGTALFFVLNQSALEAIGPSGLLALVVLYLSAHERVWSLRK